MEASLEELLEANLGSDFATDDLPDCSFENDALDIDINVLDEFINNNADSCSNLPIVRYPESPPDSSSEPYSPPNNGTSVTEQCVPNACLSVQQGAAMSESPSSVVQLPACPQQHQQPHAPHAPLSYRHPQYVISQPQQHDMYMAALIQQQQQHQSSSYISSQLHQQQSTPQMSVRQHYTQQHDPVVTSVLRHHSSAAPADDVNNPYSGTGSARLQQYPARAYHDHHQHHSELQMPLQQPQQQFVVLPPSVMAPQSRFNDVTQLTMSASHSETQSQPNVAFVTSSPQVQQHQQQARQTMMTSTPTANACLVQLDPGRLMSSPYYAGIHGRPAKKRKLSFSESLGGGSVGPSTVPGYVTSSNAFDSAHHVNTLPIKNEPNQPETQTHYGGSQPETFPDDDFDVTTDAGGGVYVDGSCQVIKWTPHQVAQWSTLVDDAGRDLPTVIFRVDADKGFNFSPPDESFVCQKKNHFQVTIHLGLGGYPKYIRASNNSMEQVLGFFLNFHGIKSESPSQSIKIEQSQSDRSKVPYTPVKIDFTTGSQVKVTVGRLHFSETTSNNMRKKGKPNPDQRYFQLVVSVIAHCRDSQSVSTTATGIVERLIASHASEPIIVRASNPGQFDNDSEAPWNKGLTPDSVVHMGTVGINTETPDEALTVHGNVKVTGHVFSPSDVRIKTDVEEMDTREQLNNIARMRLVRFAYRGPYADYAGLSDNERRLDTGVLAQEVHEILPDAVTETGSILLPNGEIIENVLVVNKDRIFIENVGAVKELCKVTDKLETRINLIESLNHKLSGMQRSNSVKSTCSSASSLSTSGSSEKSTPVSTPSVATVSATDQRRHHHCRHHRHREELDQQHQGEHHHHRHQRSRDHRHDSSSSSVDPESSSTKGGGSGLCNSRLVQIAVVVLVLVMAICLVAITVIVVIQSQSSPMDTLIDSSTSNSTNTTTTTTTTSTSTVSPSGVILMGQGAPLQYTDCVSNPGLCPVSCCSNTDIIISGSVGNKQAISGSDDPLNNEFTLKNSSSWSLLDNGISNSTDSEDLPHQQSYSNGSNGPLMEVFIKQLNITLSSQYCVSADCLELSEGTSYSYQVPLSSTFPRGVLTLQFRLLVEHVTVNLCDQRSTQLCGQESSGSDTAAILTQLPALQSDSSPLEWNLPVGFYLTSSFRFVATVGGQTECNSTGGNASSAASFNTYVIDFYHVCNNT